MFGIEEEATLTFTVLASNRSTGEVGAAAASFVLAVGARVPVVVRGRGAAAVQGGAPLALRDVVRRRLLAGHTAQIIVDSLAPDLPEDAQIGVVDSAGRTAVRSGRALEPHVSVAHGPGILVLANLMERSAVAAAALDAAAGRHESDHLADGLLAALRASDEMGGDVRGRLSAAMVIRGPRDVDLRVDHDPRPVPTLRRLHRVHLAHAALERTRQVHGVYQDLDVVRHAHGLAPDDPVCLGALVLALLRSGGVDEAVAPARQLLRVEGRLPVRLRRAAEGGTVDATLVESLLQRL
ncbi:DUF1028 domain-containing protein [Isoptericola sp. NPDC019693]|uniref:DUF1028 domain-containing protein n=1 Tax=Isoptericola sp. NPDC019693 TaxID=3364009 RepID=UPI0037885448